MNVAALSSLLLLLMAHLAGDFLFQGRAWVHSKQTHHHRSRAVYLHAGVHTGLALAALWLGGWTSAAALIAAVVIGATHLAIDILKSYSPARVRYFLLDQALHIAVLTGVWLWLKAEPGWLATLAHWLLAPRTLLVGLSYLVILQPLSILIAQVMRRWSDQVDNRGMLADAGARIGMLERFLVLTFVLADQMMPIGFLLAAKSVLRFGELREDRDRRLTEYVLLGTMLSFALTLSLGLLVRHALTML
ncbi:MULTISPECIES: DUF3307 domain-containing protein [unclassified Modicisalibacter]|uniref:DUF3307 domain-containing protein n=1 Tax=unclassified Modicisalibacter TaxID=2679913 RepID=UPI001CCB0319|nr:MULTISPECIES: DUF3307 domain-containing protein [unclassified Modicisalibacter]MBZ9556624.1 DUF3307 domain-containing protein [Modicisalibacter sp. R2A 31.J]MBZ9574907.1 DUF3307 domain-containing protein [Modicisalibacter sp. MOD 31.J]